MSNESYDVVIIGSGAGGAPLAALLAEAGRSVAVIEAGGPVEPTGVQEALRRYYLHGGYTVARGDGHIVSVLAGEALGGTTAINSGTCLDPPASLLQAWDRELGTRLAHELPVHVAAVNEDLGVSVPPLELLGPSHQLFLKGVRKLGVGEPFVLPRNAPQCQGAGRCCFGCPTGAKQSTDRAYLPRAERAGATILSLTRAERVKVEGDGVRVLLTGADGWRTLACRELVIAGGALSTPRLLRGSKLGSRWRRAGDELTIHPAAKVVAVFDDPVHGGRGVPQGMGMKLAQLPTIAFEGIFTPAEALVPLLVATACDVTWWLDRHERLASFGFMVQDSGRGRVRWPLGLPLLRYQLAGADATAMVEAAKLIARAFLQAGAERVLLPLIGAPNEVSDEGELERIDPRAVRPARVVATGFHPLGTAGLGRLVDDNLRLVGAPQVRVCDGSVLPGPPGVNPQITIMALAHRLAAQMLAA